MIWKNTGNPPRKDDCSCQIEVLKRRCSGVNGTSGINNWRAGVADLFLHMDIVAEEYDEGQRPGNRVGDQQDLVGADRRGALLEVVEGSVHPGETQTAAADDSRDHREDGALDAAEHAGAAVHEAA